MTQTSQTTTPDLDLCDTSQESCILAYLTAGGRLAASHSRPAPEPELTFTSEKIQVPVPSLQSPDLWWSSSYYIYSGLIAHVVELCMNGQNKYKICQKQMISQCKTNKHKTCVGKKKHVLLNAEICTCRQNSHVATKSRCLGWNVHVQTHFWALFQPENKSE